MVSSKPESVQIALCHLFFNIFGTLIFYPIPWMRQWPLRGAKALGEATTIYRAFPLIYIGVAFVGAPGLLLGVSALFSMSPAFRVMGVFAVVALVVSLAWFIFWWFKKNGKQSMLFMLTSRQEKNELQKNLPATIKRLTSGIELLTSEIEALKAASGSTPPLRTVQIN
jgi:sodium-dependent phosphate cotransporter